MRIQLRKLIFYKLFNEHYIDNLVWGPKTIKDWFTVLNQMRLKNFLFFF